MRTLVLCAGGAPGGARAAHGRGARVLAWDEQAAGALAAAGVVHERAAALLDRSDAEAADAAAVEWTRGFGRFPLLDGRNLIELLDFEGRLSLWWFAELYLHHSTEATHCVRLAESFLRLLERTGAEEVEAFGLDETETLLLSRACVVRGALFQGEAGRARRPRRQTRRIELESRLNDWKTAAAALKSSLAGPPPAPPAGRRVLFLSHAAFWKERTREGRHEIYEHYFDRLLPEVERSGGLRPFVVAVGPRAAFRRRALGDRLRDWFGPRAGGPYVHMNRYSDTRVRDVTWRASARARELWRGLRRSPALALAFSHRGVRFDDLGEPALAGTLLLQVPWAVRSIEEARAALVATRPSVLALYAESSGWGRAALVAARELGVPALGIQHGILYPRYYSYMHAPGEEACPRPDRTAVFGEAARRFLVEEGRYRPESLVVTGSPKFDELLETARSWDAEALRRDFGVGPGERLVAVASRYHGIRRTHQSIGSAFASLVRAVDTLPGVRLVVKPHPAEPASDYEQAARVLGSQRLRVLPPQAPLLELLHACDVLVTVESLSAVEALVLGRPVLILNMPTNLAEMVEAGAALGVAAGEDPAAALRAALDDPQARDRLAQARARYLHDVAAGVDGQATARLLRLLEEMACVLP
ncbi:MAG: UDP-N-acetylglucosamine 2-epimerase [Vicinamibacteria bacterium]